MDNEDVPVSAVGVKIPPFWEEDPEAWFGQAEAQFHLRKVKDSTTKFYHIISMLPHKVAVSVKDLTRKPPASEPYETLKFRLLQAYSMTESQKAAALIRHPPLGDRRPSQLLDTMLALLPDDHQPCFFFKYLFMEKLPKDLRGQLATIKVDDYRLLGPEADKLYNLLYPDGFAAYSAAAVNIETEEVIAVSSQSSERHRPKNRQKKSRRTRSGSNPKGRRAQPSSTQDELCYYHENFGSQARKCEGSCSFNQGNAMTGRRR